MDILENLRQEFVRRGKKLALAESCTGGAIGARIASIPDVSSFFLGSIVAYAPEWKERFLGVRAEALKQWGAESEAVVREMVAGLFARTEADYVLAVTGFAGPGGKSPGWVWLGVGERGEEVGVKKLHLAGGRKEVIEGVVEAALQVLWERIAP